MTKHAFTAAGLAFALGLAGLAQAGVVKTKTKSNQSNDRIQQADLAPLLEAEFGRLDINRDGQLDGAEQAALVKPKTKSNQSNDRCAGQCPGMTGGPGGGLAQLGAPLKGVDVKLGRGSERTMGPGADRNGDGLISRAEWLADGQERFAQADTDHDGSLDPAEAAKAGWNVKSTELR